MAGDVNFVWNYSNELSTKVFERERRFIGTFELHKHLRAAQAPSSCTSTSAARARRA
jgi:hypothetical protein